MAVSDAQKRASNKYIKEHMATLACKVRKEQASAFREYCEAQGMTSNTAIKTYVMGCIEGSETASSRPQQTVQGPSGGGVVSLPPEALETAQTAAEAAGETSAEFIVRAIDTQAKRDQTAMKLSKPTRRPTASP